MLFSNYHSFWLFADTRAKQLYSHKHGDESSGDLSALPPRIQFSIQKHTDLAFEPTTRSNAQTGWNYWEQYMVECNRSPWMDPNSKEGKLHVAGFKAALAENLHGSKIDCSSTIKTYTNQVIWCLTQRHEHKISKAVSRGIDKTLTTRKFQDSLDLTFFTTLYSKVGIENNSIELLRSVRNLLVCRSSPLSWTPSHLKGRLSSNHLIEGYLQLLLSMPRWKQVVNEGTLQPEHPCHPQQQRWRLGFTSKPLWEPTKKGGPATPWHGRGH